jgi:hypothetical protein
MGHSKVCVGNPRENIGHIDINVVDDEPDAFTIATAYTPIAEQIEEPVNDLPIASGTEDAGTDEDDSDDND